MNEPHIERIPTAGTQPNSTPKKNRPLFLVVGVLVLGIAIGIGIKTLPFFSEKGKIDEPEVSKGTTQGPTQFGEVYLIEDIIVNPEGSRRIFMCSIGLEVASPELVKEVKRREVLLRDNFNTLFSSQTVENLLDIKYRQVFRARVKKIADYQLGDGVVRRVFFEKWVVQ